MSRVGSISQIAKSLKQKLNWIARWIFNELLLHTCGYISINAHHMYDLCHVITWKTTIIVDVFHVWLFACIYTYWLIHTHIAAAVEYISLIDTWADTWIIYSRGRVLRTSFQKIAWKYCQNSVEFPSTMLRNPLCCSDEGEVLSVVIRTSPFVTSRFPSIKKHQLIYVYYFWWTRFQNSKYNVFQKSRL